MTTARRVRITSWQFFPADQRHPLLGVSTSKHITVDQDRLVRESRPVLYDASGRSMDDVAGKSKVPEHVQTAAVGPHQRDIRAFGADRQDHHVHRLGEFCPQDLKHTHELPGPCLRCRKTIIASLPHDCHAIRAVAPQEQETAARRIAA